MFSKEKEKEGKNMKMRSYTIKEKEENKNLGVELQIGNGYKSDHYLSIFANENLDLNFVMFKNGEVNNEEDLLLYADDKRISNICEGILKDNVNAYYIFDNDTKYAIMNRQMNDRGEVCGYYVFITDKNEISRLNLPESNVFDKEQVAKFINKFSFNSDVVVEVSNCELVDSLLPKVTEKAKALVK